MSTLFQEARLFLLEQIDGLNALGSDPRRPQGSSRELKEFLSDWQADPLPPTEQALRVLVVAGTGLFLSSVKNTLGPVTAPVREIRRRLKEQ